MKPSRTALALVLCALAAVPGALAQGPVSGTLVLTTVQPCRILDTRASVGGPLQMDETRAFDVVGDLDFTAQGGPVTGCGIPGFGEEGAQVQAVVLNYLIIPRNAGISSQDRSRRGLLNAWATDQKAPETSVLTYSSTQSQRLSNGAVTAVRQDQQGGDLSIYVTTEADVVADVVGYYTYLGHLDGAGSHIDVDLLDGYDTGNGANHIPLNNGQLNANLNADLLGGKRAEELWQRGGNCASSRRQGRRTWWAGSRATP